MNIIWTVAILIWFVVVGVIASVSDSVEYSVHKSQVKENCKQWAYGTYEQFVKQFEKRRNDWEFKYDTSFFIYGESCLHTSQCHASIYCFDRVGMIMKSGKDFKKSQKFLKNEAEIRKDKEVVLNEDYWNKN